MIATGLSIFALPVWQSILQMFTELFDYMGFYGLYIIVFVVLLMFIYFVRFIFRRLRFH